MESQKRTFGAHYWLRAAILLGFAMLIVHLVRTDNILLYIAPRMVMIVKLSAIGLYVIAIHQMYLAIMELRGKREACECAHPPSSSIGKNIIVYGLFALPLALGLLLPDSTMGSSLAAKKGMNLSSASQVKAELNGNVRTNDAEPPSAVEPAATPDDAADPGAGTGPNSPDGNEVAESSGEPPSEETQMMGAFPYDKFTEHFAKHAVELYAMNPIRIEEHIFMESLTTLDLYADQFQGKTMEIDGFVYRADDMAANQFVVGRFSIQCCSADAAPFGVLIEYDRAETFANDSWVRVTGTISKAEYNGTELMSIKAQKIAKIEAPKNQYVYPNFEFGS